MKITEFLNGILRISNDILWIWIEIVQILNGNLSFNSLNFELKSFRFQMEFSNFNWKYINFKWKLRISLVNFRISLVNFRVSVVHFRITIEGFRISKNLNWNFTKFKWKIFLANNVLDEFIVFIKATLLYILSGSLQKPNRIVKRKNWSLESHLIYKAWLTLSCCRKIGQRHQCFKISTKLSFTGVHWLLEECVLYRSGILVYFLCAGEQYQKNMWVQICFSVCPSQITRSSAPSDNTPHWFIIQTIMTYSEVAYSFPDTLMCQFCSLI